MNKDILKGLSIEWFKNLDTPEKKHSFALKIRSLQNDIVIKRLLEIVKDRRAALLRGPTSLDDYDNPSWSHKQADINGQIRALTYVLELLKDE